MVRNEGLNVALDGIFTLIGLKIPFWNGQPWKIDLPHDVSIE